MPLPLEYVAPAAIVLLALSVLLMGWGWRQVFRPVDDRDWEDW